MYTLTIEQRTKTQGGETEVVKVLETTTTESSIDILKLTEVFHQKPKEPRSDKGKKRKANQPELPNT